MRKFEDLTETGKVDLNQENASFYVIELPNAAGFALRGLTEMDQYQRDPEIRAPDGGDPSIGTRYWPVDREALENAPGQARLFEKDEEGDEVLSRTKFDNVDQLREALGFDPTVGPQKSFGAANTNQADNTHPPKDQMVNPQEVVVENNQLNENRNLADNSLSPTDGQELANGELSEMVSALEKAIKSLDKSANQARPAASGSSNEVSPQESNIFLLLLNIILKVLFGNEPAQQQQAQPQQSNFSTFSLQNDMNVLRDQINALKDVLQKQAENNVAAAQQKPNDALKNEAFLNKVEQEAAKDAKKMPEKETSPNLKPSKDDDLLAKALEKNKALEEGYKEKASNNLSRPPNLTPPASSSSTGALDDNTTSAPTPFSTDPNPRPG